MTNKHKIISIKLSIKLYVERFYNVTGIRNVFKVRKVLMNLERF